jgi:hypothetical protein
MCRFISVALASIVVSGLSAADSIVFDGKRVKDVVVRQDANFYYVQDPRSGKTTKLSKKRSDVRDIVIETDDSARQVLITEFDKVRAEAEGSAERIQEQQAQHQGPFDYQSLQRMKAAILWEARYESWMLTPREVRRAMRTALAEALDSVGTTTRAESYRLQGEILDHEIWRTDHEYRMMEDRVAARDAVNGAFDDFGLELYSDLYNITLIRRNVQNAAGLHNPYTDVTLEQYRQYANYEWGKAAARAAAVSQYHAQIEKYHATAIAELDSRIGEMKIDLQRLSRLGGDAAARFSRYLATLDSLERARAHGYVPSIPMKQIASWEDNRSMESYTFTVDAPVWRVDCITFGALSSSKVAIDLVTADDAKPITRVSNADFMGLRSSVLDKQGAFKIRARIDGGFQVPYFIAVSVLDNIPVPDSVPQN